MDEDSKKDSAKSKSFFTTLASDKTSVASEPDVKQEEAAVPEEKVSDSKPSAKKSKGQKILVAEDEKPLSKVMFLKLTNLGYSVTQAFNGEEVLEYIKKDNFDLILLDIVMPKLDGFEVLEELQKRGVKTPIIVMSNLSQPEDVTKVKALGAVDFLIKSDTPISMVIEKVSKFLNA